MGFNMESEVLASQWMAKEDVSPQGIELVIAGISKEEIGQDRETKYAVHFKFGGKPLLLNKTNTRILVALFGPNSDNWMGKPIIAYNDPTIGFGGQITGGVRLRASVQNPPQLPGVPAQPAQLTPEQLKQAAMLYAQQSGGSFDNLKDDVPF